MFIYISNLTQHTPRYCLLSGNQFRPRIQVHHQANYIRTRTHTDTKHREVRDFPLQDAKHLFTFLFLYNWPDDEPI
jgi:hypothetical protein